jgi:hypothetical protein
MSRRGCPVCSKHEACACPSPDTVPDRDEDGENHSLRAARREVWRDREMAREASEAAEETRRRR